MENLSRVERAKANAEKRRIQRLAIFRIATDLFRVADTLYRIIRML
ncbi:hypothetical protein ACQKII_07005 [Lysinibacillus sp. NPDC048646]